MLASEEEPSETGGAGALLRMSLGFSGCSGFGSEVDVQSEGSWNPTIKLI